MSFMYLPSVGAATLTMTIMALAVTAVEDAIAEDTAAQPSLYSTAYLPHNPYEGAVASTSTNIIRTPGNLGQVAAFHKTVETPFSSVHKSDVRYTNDIQPYPYAAAGPHPYAPGSYPAYAAGPHPYSAGPHPYSAGPHPYSAGPHPYSAGPHPYSTGLHPYSTVPHLYATGPQPYVAVPRPYSYDATPIKAHGYVPAAASPYGYGPVASPIVTPHSVSHTSFSGPYGAHYSYKR